MNKILKKIRLKFIYFVFLATIILLLSSTASILESIAIDAIARKFSITTNNYFLSFSILIIFVLISYIINLVSNYFYYMFFNKFILYTSSSVADNFYAQYSKASHIEIDKYNPSKAFNNVFNNAGLIYETSLVPLSNIIAVSLNFVFIFVYFSFKNWVLGLFVLALLLLSSLSKILFFKKQKYYLEQYQTHFNKLTSEIAYYLDRYSILYFANKQNKLYEFLKSSIYKYCQISFKRNNIVAFDQHLSTSIIEIAKVVGLIMLSLFYLNNIFSISLGLIYLFIKLINSFKEEFQSLITDIQQFSASIKLYSSLNLNLQNEHSSRSLAPIESITFKNVSLAYGQKEVINNFSCSIQKGKKYLLIGPSGSGKSTLIKALLGMLTLNSGQILLNNEAIEHFSPRELIKKINYIGPEPFVFNQDLKTNINLFEPSSNIESYLKFTQLYDEVLDKLEDKNFEADNQLSLGQKQRLCLARTLHFNKDILIMDETISNLDKLLATNIINNLIKSSITLIYITHHFDEELMSKFDQTIHILSK